MDPLSQGLLGAGLAGAISKSKNLKKHYSVVLYLV